MLGTMKRLRLCSLLLLAGNLFSRSLHPFHTLLLLIASYDTRSDVLACAHDRRPGRAAAEPSQVMHEVQAISVAVIRKTLFLAAPDEAKKWKK